MEEDRFSDIVKDATRVLQEGGLVVYPTDTSYGLACDPRLPDALERLIQAKKRDKKHGVPLLFADFDQCKTFHDFLGLESVLARLFWPGGMTLLVTAKRDVPDEITGGRDSVAIRVPDHEIPRSIARELGAPIVGTSANVHHAPTPFDIDTAKQQLGDSVELYIDGGPSSATKSSTIISVIMEQDRGHIKVYREGQLSLEELESSLKVDSDAIRLWTTTFLQADM
ncbi:MAG: threonylcarbamoyl-AMP synthase [Candidatus Thorarchaeota archaeon]|nr:MAG: threonylcarbamoyl-AMP synthase [Candidatus Thorarchaeota archaeon]